MNVLEKAEKSLEYLKNCEGSAKGHEVQAAAGTLGRCLGVLGSRSSCARHYANVLHAAIPTLLALASNESAEIRLVGDEALNRAVAGGFSFHANKINIILQNQIDPTKNARWIRSALSRICLGDSWLRPGVGKIRSQAQTLFPKLSQIVRQASSRQLIVEALEANLPRILNALHEYTTDEEISELSKALLSHVECSEPVVRRGIANCVAHLCSHRQPLLTNVLGKVFEKLWPSAADDTVVVGWFCVIKAIFQLNDFSKFAENDLFTVQDYLELYHLCIHYIELSSTEHNIQNTVMETLSVLLSHASGGYRRALLDPRPRAVCLDEHRSDKGHKRNISYSSAVSSRGIPTPLPDGREPELQFSGALHLGSVLQLTTPSLSVEDLTIQTPDSAASDTEMPLPDAEQLSKDLTEKLQDYQEDVPEERASSRETGVKVNIGASSDEDVPLKYCARLLASKFLLTGNKGCLIPDRSVRVSVKSSALSCLSVIFQLYPQAVTLYLDKDADIKFQNYSASSEGTDSNQDNINEFILERNVCFQDSLTESLSQELLKSTDSQLNTQSLQQALKKDSKSEKSLESELKSSKDATSNILDSRMTKDLVASGLSADSTNPNMTNSNFTSNSNMTGSNDHMSTGYPMTSSGDILSSSIDLDMKFDHFGESTTNLDNLDVLKDIERKEDKRCPLKRTEEVKLDASDTKEREDEKEFEFQHLSELFGLLESHNDPQIRGLVRVCIGSYLTAALDVSHGDYHRWKYYSVLPKEVADGVCTERLVAIVLTGLSDDIHSTVNHTLTALSNMTSALCNSVHWPLMTNALNALLSVETNNYWLCKVTLCKLYEKMPYQKLFMLFPDYYARSKLIMDTLFRLLSDQDQKVRAAASQTIANIIPKIYIPKRATPVSMMAEVARQHSKLFTFDSPRLSLELVRDMYFYNDLPEQMRFGEVIDDSDALKELVGDLIGRLMASNCKNYTQGLLETLQAVCRKWSPWQHRDAYTGHGIVSWCLDTLDLCNNSVGVRAALLDVCRLVYPVELNNAMRQQSNTTNRDIFERDTHTVREKWQYLESERVANLAEKFLQVTLKMLNVLVHLIEEVNPNVHLNKSGIALPGSPVRRKTQDSTPRKSITPTEPEDKTLRKKPVLATSLKANFAGHFYTEPFYMKLYENLRATYSNYKINLDPKSSIFNDFLSTVLHSLSIQLEWSTEKEFGPLTEELIYYLKVIMPFAPNITVDCVTQLLKCLFGTNMINQYSDFTTIADKERIKTKTSFFEDVLLINSLKGSEDSRRSSVCSNASQKLSLDSKNPRMMDERQLLMMMENFAKNRSDRKWSTNKEELERYIRLFETFVIQSLTSYTMQHDIGLHCSVLRLLGQLMALRVNYCMLDSGQLFIGFIMKQLDLVEHHEIPNSCDLVHSILTFLVQLSSSKHHTKQIIEIPKLIQLCDGLMASGAHAECIAGLEPVAVKVFSNMGGVSVLGRAQQQEMQATREVLFYMLQKTMHQPKVLELVSCVLSLSQEHPESYYRWSELASDTLLNLLTQRSVELDTCHAIHSLERLLDLIYKNVLELVSCVLSLSQEHPESYYRWSELASDTLLNLLTQRSVELDTCHAIHSLERLLDSVYKDVLLEQSRVEIILKILFKAPPDQTTTPRKLKLRYLSIIMVLLRKVLVLIPESEILLSINYLKSTCIAPQSIFFNVKPNVDPLNVQNFNENCANLSPDVILVRFLFKTLTYAIMEMEDFEGNVDFEDVEDKDQNRLLYSVCVNIIVQAKHMLHLTNGCLFPLTAKTAQTILHNEQSGLNTGLYNPSENIPLAALNLICLRTAHTIPLLAAHWAHLLIRLNFLSHKFWQKLIGFARNLPLSANSIDPRLLRVDLLQTACVCAYCEYFVDNGLSEAVHLSWLLVNRVHILVSQVQQQVVRSLVERVQLAAGASGLLLQAAAARCQGCLKDEFALNTYKILSLCHESQSGALVFFICRIIGKLEPAISIRFAKLAIDRCRLLKEMPVEKITAQLSKEDVQVALELLQRDKVHVKYSTLVMELNSLASSIFDLSPLDLSQDRAINTHYVLTTNVDGNWLLNQIKSRCCQRDNAAPKLSKQTDLAHLMSNLPKEDLKTLMMCSEFDRRILQSCFKVACDDFLRQFLNVVSARDLKESELEKAREEIESQREKEEMSTSVDSNKLNVVNSLQVFKKTDNKESKSQFFIPITENDIKNDTFGNLKISEEDTELIVPELPNLYQVGVATLDKSLADILHLFPKQNRPLSQSENFSLGIEQTIDRYTRRCHQVFQDKLFYQEFITIQTMLTGFLEAVDRIIASIDIADCDLLEKCIENVIPPTLARNLSIFSVVSLQYLSFLIKNKNVVESPVHADVSFRVTNVATDNVSVDHVIMIAVDNVAKALRVDEVWTELNAESNLNRIQSAISCLYAIVKYLVKDTKPLTLKEYMRVQDSGPKPDIILTGDKLVTLIEYWERNFYSKPDHTILGKKYRKPIENLLVRLARLEAVSNIALIPPMAWSYVEVSAKKDQLQKIDLPLQAFQDMDVLESFLFRVNLIGWASKKQFEEMWVGLLGALQGNGPHWAVRGLTQLLVSAAPRRAGRVAHVPRRVATPTPQMQRLRNLLVGTKAFSLFDEINLERIPFLKEDFDGYFYAQFSTEYLRLASELSDEGSFKVRREVKRKMKNKEIDVNSCLQLLMDITAEMLEPKASTGLALRAALVWAVSGCGGVMSARAHWWRAGAQLAAPRPPQPHAAPLALHALAECAPVLHAHAAPQEISTMHQKLLKSLSSSHAPLRQAALQGCLIQLTARPQAHYTDLITQLTIAVGQYLQCDTRISHYEQSLYWAVLFVLVELGHPDLMNIAVDFLIRCPKHYCTDLVVKGITTVLQQQILPKDLKNSIIEKILDNIKNFTEDHAVQMLMVHLFSADSKLISPKLEPDVSNMDPDVLMSSMERITLLYKTLRHVKSRENQVILASALKYFLRETLPPAATLSRVVIEFVECCKEAERKAVGVFTDRARWIESSILNSEVVFEVFQTAVSQDQLPVLSGWIFEALCHLLTDKLSSNLLPYSLLILLVSASSNNFVRSIAPLAHHIFRSGFKNASENENSTVFNEFLIPKSVAMSFNDRRLLCVVATHSNFTPQQLERLKELCNENECLNDLLQCLDKL